MIKRIMAVVAIQALLLLGPGAAAHAATPQSPVPPLVSSSYTVVGPNGAVYTPPKTTGVRPQLDPGTIALCNAGFGDVSVRSWNNSSIGHIDLFCGDNSSGYVHIRTDHQADWQAVLNTYPIGGSWDDLMVFATGEAITKGSPVNEGSNKYCYSAPIQIKNGSTVVTTYYPTIIVSVNNKRVITSYPTHYSSAC